MDEGGIFLLFLIHSAGSLFGFEQLLHGHRLVDMILGLGDLLARDEKPHIRVNQILRSCSASRVELCQRQLCGGQALLGGFFTHG